MRNRAALAAAVVAAAVSILACDPGSSTIIDTTGVNMPSVGNQPNAFAFAVLADGLTLDRTYQLTFTSDSSDVGLTVAGYVGGTGSLELRDATGATILTRALDSNIAEGSAGQRIGRPASARIRFTGYSGTVAIGIQAE